MKTYHVSLGAVGLVKDFVSAIAPFPLDLDLVSGRFVVDAKSIMGIFSLDLTQPLELRVHGDGGPELEAALAPYLTAG